MKKGIVAICLSLCVAFTTLSQGITVAAAGSDETEMVLYEDYKKSGSLDMSKLSQTEILQLLANSPLTMPSNVFDQEPSCTAPYATGKVSDAAIQAAVNRLNAIRRIAGLPAVAADSALNEEAQYGAVLLAAPDVSFGHYPAKPADMDESFYQKGRAATSSSNLYAGLTLTTAVNGFMDDSDPSNISRVGHRRWQLNPVLGKIGLGYAQRSGSRYGRYVAEKVFDKSGEGCEYEFVGWPSSGNFPSVLFGGDVAWSISLNPDKYSRPVEAEIKLTLTRVSDGKVWSFDGNNTYDTSYGAQYFNVDNGSYGINNCIIFRPDGVSKYDGLYNVEIEGIKDSSGKAVEFAYQVNFFTEATENTTAINETMFTIDTSSVVYDGTAKTKNVSSTVLVEGVDYTVSYTNNVYPGTATLYITGINKYNGVITKTFTIEKIARQITAYAEPEVLYVGGDWGTVKISSDNYAAENPDAYIQYNFVNKSQNLVTVYSGGTVVPTNEGIAVIEVTTAETSTHQAGSAVVNIQIKYPEIKKGTMLNGDIELQNDKMSVGGYVSFRAVPNEGYETKEVFVTDKDGNPVEFLTYGQDTYYFFMPQSDVTIWANYKKVIPAHDCYIADYTDVNLDEWYHVALDYVVSEQIMTGTSANTFEPGRKLTRSMLAQILYSREGKPSVSGEGVFTDVAADAWYTNAVNWAASIQIVSGYPDGTFAPEADITREQMVAILYKYAGFKGYAITGSGDLTKYGDKGDTSIWALPAMEWAVGNGLMSGKSETLLDPTATATRAEAAQVLTNFCKLFEE